MSISGGSGEEHIGRHPLHVEGGEGHDPIHFSHELEQELLQPDLRVEDDNLGAGGGGAGEGQHQLMLGIVEKLSGGLPGVVKQV